MALPLQKMDFVVREREQKEWGQTLTTELQFYTKRFTQNYNRSHTNGIGCSLLTEQDVKSTHKDTRLTKVLGSTSAPPLPF